MSRQTKSTMVELVTELEKLLAGNITVEQREGLAVMVAEAKAGEYHDFKNQKYPCGKVASAGYLRAMGFVDLAREIENGDYDEFPDEEDNAHVREIIDKHLLRPKH